jgi:hypothetical protein
MVRLTRKMWLTAEKDRAVEDGDESAAFLLGGPGDEISKSEAERLGLLGATGEGGEPNADYARQVDAHSGMAAPGVDPSEVAAPGPGQGDPPSPIGEEIAGHDVTLGDEVVPELVAAEEERAAAIEASGRSADAVSGDESDSEGEDGSEVADDAEQAETAGEDDTPAEDEKPSRRRKR